MGGCAGNGSQGGHTFFEFAYFKFPHVLYGRVDVVERFAQAGESFFDHARDGRIGIAAQGYGRIEPAGVDIFPDIVHEVFVVLRSLVMAR